jgi:Fic family protein
MVKYKILTAIDSAKLHQAINIGLYCQYLYLFINKNTKIKLDKDKKLNTTASFLSVEGEDLKFSQIKKILGNQSVNLPADEIKAVKNASRVYHHLKSWNALSMRDFKAAHAILLKNLNDSNGGWRKGEVVVVEGKKIAYVPPNAKYVTQLMRELFHYAKKNRNMPWLIKACVFHYGVQFIHPFSDGNGRMGRVWQHLMLLQESPLFRYILIGDLIKKNATQYYDALDKSDKHNTLQCFMEFCFAKITTELNKMAKKWGAKSFSAYLKDK